jgi:hypothetical protein
MVQIIPRTRPTFGEQVSSGIQQGAQTGQQLGQMFLQNALSQKAKQEELSQKQKFANEIMNDPALSGLDPTIKRMLAYETAGLTSAQSTKSTINALREKLGDERFSELIGGIDKADQQENMMPSGEVASPGIEAQPELTSKQSTVKSERDYESEIKNWQRALREAKSPENKAFAESRIKELQRQEDIGIKKGLAHTKDVRASFTENQNFIDKTHDQYEDSLRRESILDRMDQLSDSGELSESGIVNFLESLGLQQEWLKNPANEEYTKLALDLLGGGTLQADYGSRVLQSEFKVSQQRIPTLMQTPEGRRQISENIKTMLLPSRLKNERMQFYLDQAERTGKPLPHDLRGKVLRDIKPQLEEAYDKFKQRNGRYKVRLGTYPDDNALEKYFYLSNGNENSAIKMMEEDGYDVSQ